MFKADIYTKICLETMRYFWKKATEEYSSGAHRHWGHIITHCSHSKTHF